MPKFNPDRLNIKDLTIESPEKETELSFNPEKDIDPEQWERINKYYNDFSYNPTSHTVLIGMIRDLWILGHMQTFSDVEVDGISGMVDTYSAEDRATLALFGHKQELTDYVVHSIVNDYNTADIHRGKKARDIILMGRADLIPRAMEQLTENLKEIRAKHPEASSLLLDTAVAIKLLGGDPVLTPGEWQAMKDGVNNDINNERYSDALEDAAELTILSADKVVIPENGGLELVKNKKEVFKTGTPEMPEQRNF